MLNCLYLLNLLDGSQDRIMAEKKTPKASDTDYKTDLIALRKEQFNLRMQRGTGQLTNSSRFKYVRREIARIKTKMNETARSS